MKKGKKVMYKQSRNKKPKRNSRTEKYNDWDEKFTKRFKDRLEQSVERTSALEDKTRDIIKSEENKKDWRKVNQAQGTYGTSLSRQAYSFLEFQKKRKR